jgi:TetR/AcrR family transcriptional repressor of mexJK operon
MDKTSQIIESAQELFGKYGFAKTTMTDIAQKLEISKASLYYYYPDKESIYLAVISKEQAQFIEMLHKLILETENPIEVLYQYIQIRIEYFSSMLNLNRARFDDFKGLNNEMKDSWKNFREMEKKEIQLILQKGIENNIFEIENSDQIISLFLDTFKGLVFNYLKNRDFNFLNDSDYQNITNQLTLFTKIFIKGIGKI